MNSISNNHSLFFWKDTFHHLFGADLQKKATEERDIRIATTIQEVLNREHAQTNKALSDKLRRYPISMIGEDLLNIAMVGCIGAAAFCTSSPLMKAIIGFSLIGGVFNLAQSVLSFQEGLSAWKSNDRTLAMRLMLQGVIGLGVGTAMILYSCAHFFALTGIAAFFTANPYIIPVLVFALTTIMFIETMHQATPLIRGTDLSTGLELPQLRSIIHQKDPELRAKATTEWVHRKIKECISSSPEGSEDKVIKQLDTFKEKIGISASLEIFRLFEMILAKKEETEILRQIQKVEKTLTTRNQALYLKLLSITLCVISFGVGMSAVATNSAKMDGIQNLTMSVGNFIPLYIDVKHPFEREIPIVVGKQQNVSKFVKVKTDPKVL